MVSLQQLSFECCDSSVDILTEKVVVAIHRRTWTILLYSKASKVVDFVQHSESSGTCWNTIASWAPKNVSNIVAVLPLEAYDCFVVVAECHGKSMMVLLSLKGEVMEEHELGVSDVLSAEVDQQKREVFLGLKSGKLLCYYLHSKLSDAKPVAANKSSKISTLQHKAVVHITLRRQVRLKCTVDAGSVNVPVQIVSVDLLGFCLVLLASGSVVCYSSSRFDVLFEISSSFFSLKPCRLWADKFGADFVVQSRSADGATEQLEYWTPPADYTSCELGRFGRIAIPLHGPLLGLSIESVGVDGGEAFLATITTDQNVQLWRPMGDGTLLFESRISLSVPEKAAAMLSSASVKASSVFAQDDFFSGLRFQGGLFCFAKESQRLPDDQLIFVVSLQTAVCKLGVHLPSSLDNHYNNIYAEISIALLQAEHQLLDEAPQEIDYAAMFAGPRPPAATHTTSGYKTLMDDQVSALSASIVHRAVIPVGDLFNDSLVSNSLILGSEDGGVRSLDSHEPLPLVVESNSNLYISLNDFSALPAEEKEDAGLAILDPQPPVLDNTLNFMAPTENDAVVMTARSNNDTESEAGFSQEQMIQHMLSVHSAGAEYDPISPLASFRLERTLPTSRGLSAMANHKVKNLVVAPETDFFAPQQLLLLGDITRSDSAQGIVRGGQSSLLQLVAPFGMVIQSTPKHTQHDYSMQVVSRQGLLDARHLQFRSQSFQELPFKLSCVSYRTGLLCVVTSMREVFLFDIGRSADAATKAPLPVEFEIRQSALVHSVLVADVLLQHPAKPVGGKAKAKSVLRKSDQVAVKVEVDIVGAQSLVLVGDSDGRVHYAVATASTVCGFGMLRAHAAPIQSIVVTGDPVRPMWKVGSERSVDCDHIVPVAVPGSAMVTMSREGEVKVWQPVFRAKSTKGRSGIEKAFLTYSLDWRLSGIVAVNDPVPKGLPSRRASFSQNSVTSGASATPSNTHCHPDAGRKIKGVESAVLDPTCMHLLVSFKNGFLEQWVIPGLIDTGSGLATSQSACWVNSCHSDSVHHLGVYVHSADTAMVEVDVSRDNERRDEVIADLAAYVKGSAGKTVGYTYKQLKTLTNNSSLVTSSKDLSVIVWGFAFSRTFSEASSTYLVPQPCRKFTFSAVPTHGLCYCTTLNVNVNFLQGSTWRVSAIVSGIVVTAFCDVRSALFVTDSTVGSEVSAEQLADGESIHFEDDLFFEEAGQRARSRLKHSLASIPTICSVSKPAQIVTPIAAHITNNDHRQRSWTTLSEWALVEADEAPLCLHYDTADEEEARTRPSSPDRASPTRQLDATATTTAAHFKKVEFNPLGETFTDLTGDETETAPPALEVTAEGLQKFVFGGIHMVADEAAEEHTVRALTPAKYSVTQIRERNTRRSMEWSPPSGDQQDRLGALASRPGHGEEDRPFSTPIKRTSFAFEPNKSFLVSVNDSNISSGGDHEALKELPPHNLVPFEKTSPGKVAPDKSPVKHIANLELHPPVDADSSSKRRSMSISSVSFSRDSKVVKVIALDVGVDFSKQQPAENRASDIRLHSQENNVFVPAAETEWAIEAPAQSALDSKQELVSEPEPLVMTDMLAASIEDFALEQQQIEQYAQEAKAAGGVDARKRQPAETDDHSMAESLLSGLSDFSETDERAAKSRDTRSALLRQRSQVSKKNRLDLLVKGGEEPVYTSKPIAARPDQGVRQQLGKNAIFATIGKLGTSQKIVIQKEGKAQPKALSRAPSHTSIKEEKEESAEAGAVMLFDDRSFGEPPSPVKEGPVVPSSGPAEKHVVKPLSFMLNVADDKMVLKRKNAVKVVQSLLPKVPDLDTGAAESDDDKSVISSYFDRSAPPIYAPKAAVVKKRLVSKRFDPVVVKTPEQGAAADLNKLLSGLSAEERRLLDSLGEEARQKLLDELKKTATGKKGGKGKAKDLFKTMTTQLLAEAAEEAQLSMDVKLDVLEATDRAISVSISSLVGGNVVLVMANFNESYRTPSDALYDRQVAEEVQGYLSHQCCQVAANSFVEATFEGLKPLQPYIVYAIIDRSAVAHKRGLLITDDEDENMCVYAEASTLTEQLELEWGRLNEDMRRVEVKAALRSKLVQTTARNRFPPLVLPTDDDIDLSDATMETFRADPSSGGSVWLNFLRWWVGDSEVVPTVVRSDFLFYESVAAVRDPKTIKRFVDQRFCSSTEIDVLSKFAEDAHYVLSQTKAKRDQVANIREFKRFRSWYKGGQVALDREDEESNKRNRSGSVSSRGTHGTQRTSATAHRDSPVLDTEKVSVAESQLVARTAFLHSRVDEVDRCKMHAARLVEGHRFAVANGLKDNDLMFKRASLSGQDIMSIMCSIKLNELCVAHDLCAKDTGIAKIDPALFGTPVLTTADVAGVDTFVVCNPDTLKPDDPPAVDLACLPGTNRKPLKAWQLCSKEEKTLELTLACCLDAVLDIAIMSGVAVPDPEDVMLAPGQFPLREKRWKDFREWYAGDEETNPVPGKGIPSLQRVVFAETTETRNVEDDPLVVNSMVAARMQLPQEVLDKAAGTVPKPPSDVVQASEGDADKPKAESLSFEAFSESLLRIYERAASTVSGGFLRFDLLCRNIAAVLTCRRISMMRLMWPPGAARLGSHYMFPRMGLLTAKFELPAKRIKLFPARNPVSYSHKEILGFYSEAALDADDKLMLRAEKDGVKLRAYYDWLTKEKERVEEGRLDMFNEDCRSRLMRDTHIEVERSLAAHGTKLNRKAEKLDEDEDAPSDPDAIYEEFHFMHAVPKEYWYIFEESCEFMHGSGVNNGDEVEELRLEEIARANKAVQDAIKFENYLQEEKNRREMLEQERLRREETDRRLAEGVARRRHLREHFEDLKKQRVKAAEDEAKKVEQDRVEVLLQKERDHQVWLVQREIEREAQRVVDENALMQAEERYMTDLRLRIKETRRMEHEDIASFVREQQELRQEEVNRQRYAELQELYVPFEPFEFKHSRVKKPVLHAILNTTFDAGELQLPAAYQDAMDDAQSHQSHNSKHTVDTSSSLNKRSLRYKQLYEGSMTAPSKTGSAKLDAEGSLATRENKPFEWLRVSHKYPEVMPLTHSPTKKAIRNDVAAGIGMRGYDQDWTLQRDISPACFVLTAKQAPLRPLSTGDNNRRSLSSLAPLLEPLKDTSVFLQHAKTATVGDKRSTDSFPFLPTHNSRSSVLKKSSSEQLSTPRGSLVNQLADKAPPRPLGFPSTGGELEFNDSISFDQDAASVLAGSVRHGSIGADDAYNVDHTSVSGHGLAGNSKLSADDGSEAELASTFSLFRSRSDNIIVQTELDISNQSWQLKQPDHRERRKTKELISQSAAAATALTDQKWLDMQKTQKKLMMASLSSIDAKAHGRKGRADAHLLQKESKAKLAEMARLKQELKELGIVETGALDFKTKQLAKTAGESVMRLRLERDLLKQYVGSGAVMQDQFYMMACEPGLREKTSLEASEDVQRYVQQIDNAVSGENDSSYLSNRNVPPIAATKSSHSLKLKGIAGKKASASDVFSPGLASMSTVSQSASLLHASLSDTHPNRLGVITGNPVTIQTKQSGVRKAPASSPLSSSGRKANKADESTALKPKRSVVVKTPSSSRLLFDGEASVDSADTRNTLRSRTVGDDSAFINDALKGIVGMEVEAGDSGFLLLDHLKETA